MPTITRTATFCFPALLLTTFVGQVNADVRVDFVEGAPRDRFVITNAAGCDLSDITMAIDLSTSVGRLIFDTTADGAGVEVFQPFDAGNDGARIRVEAPVSDGDSIITLSIDALPAEGSLSFTIDVDDTLTDSELGQIRVSDSEVTGGLITLESESGVLAIARFDETAGALLELPDC